MAFLIDTCALSEFTRPAPSPAVDTWFAALPPGADFVSALTLGELEQGITKLPVSKRRAGLEAWFAELRTALRGRILPVDEAVALEWGRLSARARNDGAPLPVIDALLAATALVHRLTVVTRNTSDLARTGVPLVDPWQAG